MNAKNIIINSSLLFIISSVFMTNLHELGHFITAIVVKAENVRLFHNYVTYDSDLLPLHFKILITAAGPIVSLLVGLLFHMVCANYKQRNLLFLFYLYMTVFGYISFFGYLMVSPFFIEGDTGYIFNELGFSFWLTLLISFTGIASIFFILKKLSKYFAEMGTKEVLGNADLRKQFANSLILYPLFIGIISTTLLNLPVPVFLSLLYPLFSPLAIMFCYGNLLGNKYSAKMFNENFHQIDKIQPMLFGYLALIIIMNRLLVLDFSVH